MFMKFNVGQQKQAFFLPFTSKTTLMEDFVVFTWDVSMKTGNYAFMGQILTYGSYVPHEIFLLPLTKLVSPEC